jgi:signal transduction histidine kinase
MEPVDLQVLVAEVVTERTDHLRAGRDGLGEPALFPDIYTGPLPTVYADHAMLRQLIDNLIGNALKYTLPGQPARIDISAHTHTDDGWVRIEIADRGVGIPAADQPRVFASFHRAASHTRDYAGTGLGLAICQRIIDRHGGTISVADNPGGGTRISFTMAGTARRLEAEQLPRSTAALRPT